MGEWWTYSLADFLLFAPRTYYRLFELHNAALWPAHVAALAAGAAAIGLVRRGSPQAWRAAALLLAAAWAFSGWAFHLERYATINWAAPYFAAGFGFQALLFAWAAFRRCPKRPAGAADARRGVALGLAAAALVLLPLVGPALGRPWSQAEIFGIAPDPTALVSVALLAAARVEATWLLMIVPMAWSVIGGLTLFVMGAADAAILPGAAVLAAVLAASGHRRGTAGRA